MESCNMIYLGVSGLFKKETALKRAEEILQTEKLGNHPDFLLIEPTGDVIKVEEVRKIAEHISYAPIEAARKVVVIVQAHLATEEFQNSILKFLEDYTTRCTFLLTAERPLLDTIHSRCTVIQCAAWGKERMLRFIKQRKLPVDDEALALAAGRPGLYCDLFDVQADLLNEAKQFAKKLNEIGQSPKRLFDLRMFGEEFFKSHTSEQVSLLMDFIQGCFMQLLYYQMEAETGDEFGFLDRKAADNIPITTLMPIVERCLDDKAVLTRKGKYGKNEYFDFARYVYTLMAG